MTSTIQQLSDPYGPVHLYDVGEGEPLILLHGVGMQLAAWGPQIEAFQKTHRVIALDLPGHGQSARLPTGATLVDYVAWLRAVLTALDLSLVNLAGHSMGALISGGYAATYPEKLHRVALLNGVHCRDNKARQAVETRAFAIAKGKVDFETPVKRWFRDTVQDIAVRDQVLGWLRSVDIQSYATAYQAFATEDQTFAKGWTHVTCPLLALTADGDPNSTPEMSRAMAAAAQDGEAVVIDGHRHMVSLTAPDVVNAHLRHWLGRIPKFSGEN